MRSVWTQQANRQPLRGAAIRHGRGAKSRISSGARLALKTGIGIGILTAIAVVPSQAKPMQALNESAPSKVTRIDAELANAYIRAGRTKSECVCTARILREALPAHDYAPSALLQTANYSDTATAARLTLSSQGLSPSEVKALDVQRRKVVRTHVEPVCRRAATAGSATASR